MAPPLKKAMAGSSATPLGVVREGDDLAHVVCRMAVRLDEGSVTQVNVVTLKRHGDGWKMLLTTDLEKLAAGLRRGRPRKYARPPPRTTHAPRARLQDAPRGRRGREHGAGRGGQPPRLRGELRVRRPRPAHGHRLPGQPPALARPGRPGLAPRLLRRHHRVGA